MSTEMSSNRQSERFYACRRCGERLFDASHVTHETLPGNRSENVTAFGSNISRTKALWAETAAIPNSGCTSVFTSEAPEWASCGGANEGRVTCPKCQARVGNYAWSGAPCSCGKWVTPSFQFQLARIDPKDVVSKPFGSRDLGT